MLALAGTPLTAGPPLPLGFSCPYLAGWGFYWVGAATWVVFILLFAPCYADIVAGT